MAIEGTGIKAPSKKASRMAMATYKVDPMDKVLRDMDKAFKNLSNQESTGAVKETGRGMGDTFNPFKDKVDASDQIENRSNFFSPDGGAFDERNDVQIASADGIQSLSQPGSDEFNKELDQYEKKIRYEHDIPGQIDKFGTDELGDLTEEGKRRLEDSYKIYRDFNYERNPLKYVPGEDFSKKEEKKGFGERISNLAGNIFNTVTGTQPAAASQIPGGLPSGNQFSPSGDTSFSSFRMGGGVEGQQSGIVTPFSQTSMGKGEPRNITKFQDTSMGRRPVSNLPSDYKQTEAREFAKAKAYQQANKNPNVTTSIDSKGQVTVSPVQRGRGEAGTSDNTAQGNQARVQQNAKARAQAAAYNRRISGKSISQTKADNKAAVRKSAAERQAAFKKTGKSTVSARRAAAKASVKAAAKKRNAAFKARRKARTRRSTRGRRGRGRGRGR
mgnify:CR=1 FL=1